MMRKVKIRSQKEVRKAAQDQIRHKAYSKKLAEQRRIKRTGNVEPKPVRKPTKAKPVRKPTKAKPVVKKAKSGRTYSTKEDFAALNKRIKRIKEKRARGLK